MGAWDFYTISDVLIAALSKPPRYDVLGGRRKNIVSAETLGGLPRSETRGVDRRTLALDWPRLPLADAQRLDALHAAYGGNAASFRIEVPDGALPGIVGGARIRVRWPETHFTPVWTHGDRYNASLQLLEDPAALVQSGTLTMQNAKLSLASGAAFADFVGVTLWDNPPAGSYRYLVVTDSAGHRLAGWMTGPGSGVTYGSELLTNGGFDSGTSGWTGNSCTLASVTGGQSGNCLQITRTGSTYQVAFQVVAVPSGASLRLTAYVKSGTSGNEPSAVGLSDSSGVRITLLTSSGTWQQNAVEWTAAAGVSEVYAWLNKSSATAGTMLFDTASLKQVLTPSANGATVVSARGGSTSAWAVEETGFNRNDADGYRFTVYAY